MSRTDDVRINSGDADEIPFVLLQRWETVNHLAGAIQRLRQKDTNDIANEDIFSVQSKCLCIRRKIACLFLANVSFVVWRGIPYTWLTIFS